MGLEEEAQRLVSKCGGLPNVIINVARYLSTKAKDIFSQEMRHLNHYFRHELVSNAEFDLLREVQAWMHSYWQACPRHLKKYVLYLSIFPQEIIIRRRRLIKRWIAEGYSKGTDSNSNEMYAEKIFMEVTALSIMEPVLEARQVIGYRFNSLFRDYIMSRPAEETIFFPVEVSVLEYKGLGRLATDGVGQHLAVANTLVEDPIVFASLDLTRLRSLTSFGFFQSFYVSDRMRVLRVLDLENSSSVGDSDFMEIGQLPSRLKFLSLRGQWLITQLPESVANLVHLQSLDIRDTRIVMLPAFITRLRKLQHIRAGRTVAWTDNDMSWSDAEVVGSRSLAPCLPKKFLRQGGPVGSRSGGVLVPRGIKKLKALQSLGVVCVNTADGEAILDEIASLPQLRKLQVFGISGKHTHSIMVMTGRSRRMESMTFQFLLCRFDYWNMIISLSPMRSLKMYGNIRTMPRRIMNECPNLEKLTVKMSALFYQQDMMVIGNITNLRTLRIHVNKDEDQDGELNFLDSGYFGKLEVLEIACRCILQIRFDDGALQKLEQLNIHCLEGAVMQVSGLEHLVSLKEVWLLRSFDKALRKQSCSSLSSILRNHI